MIWEYKRISKSTSSVYQLDSELTQLGALGWEVCGFMSADKTIGLNAVMVILKRERPGLPPPDDGTGAKWHPDPSGRFDLRWWDGLRWTEHVSTGGKNSVDNPIPGPPGDAGSG